MKSVTTQDKFHPMKGHVTVGTEINMENGDTLTLFNRVKGWVLVDQNNNDVCEPTTDCMELATIVFNYGR